MCGKLCLPAYNKIRLAALNGHGDQVNRIRLRRGFYKQRESGDKRHDHSDKMSDGAAGLLYIKFPPKFIQRGGFPGIITGFFITGGRIAVPCVILYMKRRMFFYKMVDFLAMA